ncbi:MAG: LicD family protein, partial [Lachnospiraceae bacterium]|nr:LicD family protein [Lachnospiraceae bacterium]
DLDSLCKKYNIKYMADSGTLIGAIRHGGFIPWDDDLDVVMLRDDYELFLQHRSELPDNYTVLSWRDNDEWSDAYARIVNTKSIRFEDEFLNQYHGFPYSAGVDVFVLDYMYPDVEKENERTERVKLLFQIGDALRKCKKADEEFWHMVESSKYLLPKPLNRQENISKQFLLAAEEGMSEVKAEEAEKVCFMSAWLRFHSSDCEKRAYDKTMLVPFEIMEIPVPVSYDEVLKSRYGDYMTVNKTGGMHDYPYYRTQENMVMNKFNWKSWNYTWIPEEVKVADNIRNAREKERMALKEKITQLEHTIQMAPDLYAGLQGQIDALKQNVHMDENATEEVVFLTIGGSAWNHYQYFWELETQKENTEVFVMPVPYFDTTYDGSVFGEHYIDNGYPEELHLVSFNDYNLEARHPKRIYFQIPYDSENPSFTVHPVFYTNELLKYTDELIYVPYLDIKEIAYSDEKSFYSMNYYVKMPGVMHADKVYVPTDNMRGNYIRALVDFSGEEMRSFWEEKVVVADYMKEEKKDSAKKSIYFYTDAAPFLLYKEAAVEKLRQNLEFFENNKKKLEVYWEVYGRMEQLVKEQEPKVYEAFIELVNEYKEKEWIHVLNDPRESADLLNRMDAFYGDPGQQAHEANIRRIPVLLRDIKA